MIYKIIFLIFVSILVFTKSQSASELQIYADSIDYDSNKNLIAKGNVKLIKDNEIITTSIVIINEEKKIIKLPKEFKFKDQTNQFYYGSSGEFSTDFENGKINDYKMLLSDGSRIVGHTAYKTGKIDLLDKGVYSPCESKINIKNFICPIWQVEGEKILHDRENLFIHTKHAKMRVFNFPIYYFPYIITPSPLRKERKSGFLNPSISFNFIDTKTTQAISFPYYFVIDQDKELLLTPTINYGGGVDASQHIVYEYDQIISGGDLSINFSTDTNIENDNNESWLRDASLQLNLKQNLNENYNMEFASALQSSPTYLRRTDQNNFLNRNNTLSTTFNLNGFEVREKDDNLHFNITGYQVVRNNEDNKTTPTSFPYVKYISGLRNFKGNKYNNHLKFYNIFRDISTDDHAQQQQKIEYILNSNKIFYPLFAKAIFSTEIHSQFYNIQDKKNGEKQFSGTYSRFFPMTGLYFETPLINKKNNLLITPKVSFVVNSPQGTSNKISNEESTNNSLTILNSTALNRYTGTDKLDNSKRINYGVEATKNNFKLALSQSYEFEINSNFAKEAGLKDYMSDLLGSASYTGDNNTLEYGFRLNVDQGLIAAQNLSYNNQNNIGNTGISYSQERAEVNSILSTGTETLDILFSSKNFYNYSSLSLNATFDLVEDDPTQYNVGYAYIDECFGINIDFARSFYQDRDLEPSDTLTIMFKFKHLGSYKSTNLAVSELDKQDIQWDWGGVDDNKFK